MKKLDISLNGIRHGFLPYLHKEASKIVDYKFANDLFTWVSKKQIHSIKSTEGLAPRWGSRVCSVCGVPMNQGWVGDGGIWNACSAKCLFEPEIKIVESLIVNQDVKYPIDVEARNKQKNLDKERQDEVFNSINKTLTDIDCGRLWFQVWDVHQQHTVFVVGDKCKCDDPDWLDEKHMKERTTKCSRNAIWVVSEGDDRGNNLRFFCRYCKEYAWRAIRRDWGYSIDDEEQKIDWERLKAIPNFNDSYRPALEWFNAYSFGTSVPTKIVRVFESKENMDAEWEKHLVEVGAFFARIEWVEEKIELDYDPERPKWDSGVFQ